jgi:hypothetical protein
VSEKLNGTGLVERSKQVVVAFVSEHQALCAYKLGVRYARAETRAKMSEACVGKPRNGRKNKITAKLYVSYTHRLSFKNHF